MSQGAGSRALKVETAVKRDLAELAKRDPRLATSGMAASLLALAREIDKPGNSATSKSMCAKALNETWADLLARAPAEEVEDRIDDLSKRRAARIARGSTA